MIGVIGTRRMFFLTVLLAVNAFMAAAVFLYVAPQNEKAARDLRSTKAEIAAKQSDTQKLQNEYQLIQTQKASFEHLKAAGFLGPQDRVQARERMEAIRNHSRVLQANYSIEPVKVEENVTAAESGNVVLSSVIRTEISALDDLDIFSFVYWLENGFTGQITVSNFEIKRESDIDDITLRQIGTGSPVVVVKGNVDFEWRTMVPREEAGSNLAERF